MPNYDYTCDLGHTHKHWQIPYEEREAPRDCLTCGRPAEYQFPVSQTFWGPLEEHEDEGLGIVVRGRRERDQAMKSLGLQEAGDTVGGARNFESENVQVGKRKPDEKSMTLSDVQRIKDNERKHRETATVNGKLIKDLPDAKSPLATKIHGI